MTAQPEFESEQQEAPPAATPPPAATAPVPPATPGATAPAAPAVVAAQLPGVPHDLGLDRRAARDLLGAAAAPVSDSAESVLASAPAAAQPARPVSAAADVAQSAAAPAKPAQQARSERSAQQVRSERSAQQSQRAGERAGESEKRPYRRDFMATLLLLAAGTFGALTLAQSMLLLRQQLHLMAAAVPQHDLAVPAWAHQVGQGAALVILSLYAVTLLWSIARVRARKLAFWVPLTAGAVAVVLTTAILFVALTATIPLAVLNDPTQMQLLLDAMQQTP